LSNLRALIGRPQFEPVRNVFRDEARHFTTWLEQNLEVLAERLGIELTLIQREKAVGDFNVDLLCEDESGRPVIVENQLERTDHDHLGKLLTYLVNLNASAAIWVTGDPRPEHEKVVDWLNESTGADTSFYLVKVEAIRIGESSPAPLFTVIAAPDEQSREVGEKKKEWAARHFKREEFWRGLLDRSKQKTKLFATISPGKHAWIGTGSGKSGVTFNYVLSKDSGASELYIDHDRQTGKMNKAIFDALEAQKKEIEAEFGSPLEWERLNDRRACRIRKRFEGKGMNHPESWTALQDDMIDAMIRLDKSLRGRLPQLNISA
jgi:hypothetical protein